VGEICAKVIFRHKTLDLEVNYIIPMGVECIVNIEIKTPMAELRKFIGQFLPICKITAPVMAGRNFSA
jgi:hypothetical protein